MLSGHGASAYETGTQSFSSNALRSYNSQGKRRHKPSVTSSMRAALVASLMKAYTGIRRIKIKDTGIDFRARVWMQSGRVVHRSAYNLQNLYGLLNEGISQVLAV